MNKYTGLLIGLGLMLLIATKPWHVVNRAVGLTPGHVTGPQRDSIARLERDSLFIETMAMPMVLAEPVADTLAAQIERRERYRDHLLQKDKELATETELLAARHRQLEHKIVLKKQLIEHEQQTMVSLTEVEALLAKQKKQPLQTDRTDPRTGLYREIVPKRPLPRP